MEYLADTVALIRHLSKTGKIGKEAKQILKAADQGTNLIYISIMSMIEIMYLADGNKIPIDFDAVKTKIAGSDNYQIVDLNMEIVTVAKEIKGLELHDRLIVASSKYLDVPILTTDDAISALGLIKVIW